MSGSNYPWGMSHNQLKAMFPEEFEESERQERFPEPDPNEYYDDLREREYERNINDN